MSVSISCPACGARLKAPDGAAGRSLRCPRCQGPVVVPAAIGPTKDFAFDRGPATGVGYSGDEGNPFEGSGPAEEPETTESEQPRKGRRPTAKKRTKEGYNPFDEAAGGDEPAADQPKKRRYRKDGDYNPFGDAPQTEAPDPVGEGFEFGIEAPPEAPASEFDFGPLDPRRNDVDDPQRRRR